MRSLRFSSNVRLILTLVFLALASSPALAQTAAKVEKVAKKSAKPAAFDAMS